MTPDEIEKAFKSIDTDHDGQITPEQLNQFLISKGKKMTPSELDAFIKAGDEDCDGQISLDEFQKMFANF